MKATRLTIEVAASQLSSVQAGAAVSHFAEVFGLMEERASFLPPHQAPVVEPTREDNLGGRGAAETGGERPEHLLGKSYWQPEEGCPVLGDLSQSEIVRLKSWKES